MENGGRTPNKVQWPQIYDLLSRQGSASPGAKRDHWVGHHFGDIFVVGPQGYVMIPAGGSA